MEWCKSCRSGNASNCVELRQDLSAVRDSKRPGVSLPVARDAVRELITKLCR
ncbi:DUF397 domain-containing protein [Actinokineospora sp. PR83]|uniref:DUF397 domain-containing protein n=1 Tax=Actinokineospora sp. PR83 TaxID=2884908 RepID=UPI001F32F6BE|nr:DUF397 domain-containing protein [Actinokineospora sp. PR83]MCG8917423.1 DUF397 domain-containing protein [Actinokineospora sp. PR83]